MLIASRHAAAAALFVVRQPGQVQEEVTLAPGAQPGASWRGNGYAVVAAQHDRVSRAYCYAWEVRRWLVSIKMLLAVMVAPTPVTARPERSSGCSLPATLRQSLLLLF